MYNFIIGIALAILMLVADYISKLMIVQHFVVNSNLIKITDFLNIVLVYNKGISFGLFNDSPYSNKIFAIIAVIICGFLLSWLKKADKLMEALSLGLVIGGACGNILDRFLYIGVVDFLQFHWQEYYWPNFNIADSSICLGVFLLFIGNLQTNVILKKEDNI